MKINEIKLEVNSRKKYVGDLDSRIGDIRNAQDQDLIESFEKYVTGNFLVFEKIATWEDLLQAFTDYFGQLPSENLQKVLEKQSHDILWKVNENKRIRSEHPAQIRMNYLPSSSNNLIDAAHTREENREFNELTDRKRNEDIRLTFLEESKRDYERELYAIAYPRFMKLGFISFISFAILGVVIPFTYGWWSLYLKGYSNIFGIGMFGVGLVVAFLYIYLEMSFSLKK